MSIANGVANSLGNKGLWLAPFIANSANIKTPRCSGVFILVGNKGLEPLTPSV
jgi:hypothetical protein